MKTLKRLAKILVVAAITTTGLVLFGVLLHQGMFSDQRWFLVLFVLALIAAAVAAWFNHRSPEYTPAPPAAPRQWLVWDTELDAELSDVERRMLLANYPWLGQRVITTGQRADLCDPYEEKRYGDGQGDE